MSFRRVAFGVLAGLLMVSGSASALEISRVTSGLIRAFENASPEDAQRYLADYTVLVRLWGIDRYSRAVIPISGSAVLYFAPSGKVLAWSARTDTVEAGQWQIKPSETGENTVCMSFPEGRGSGVCVVLDSGGEFIVESTKGNPFGLQGERAAPYSLGQYHISLQGIARELGL